MPLSRASCVIRVSSNNQRNASTRLLVGAQRAGVLAGTSADPLGVQQTRQEQHAVLGHVEDSGVCDTHGGAEPLCR